MVIKVYAYWMVYLALENLELGPGSSLMMYHVKVTSGAIATGLQSHNDAMLGCSLLPES
jgi:hypothetical protein